MADIKISQLPAASAPGAADTFEVVQGGVNKKATAAQLSALVPKGYIDGLKMEWVSGTSLRLTTGAAYIPSLGRLVEVSSPITKTVSLAANTWGHMFLLEAAGTGDFEVVTTAPAAPYSGRARAKFGDTSRRYIGSIKTDGAGSIINFKHSNDDIYYQSNVLVAPFLVVSMGNAVAFTAVACSALAPETSRAGMFIISNADAGSRVDLGNSEAGAALMFVSQGNSNQARLPMNTSREITYKYDTAPAPGAGVNIRMVGYEYER